MKLILLLLFFSFSESKYIYLGNVDNNNIIYKSGQDGWDKWAEECDALGQNCLGFDSLGYIKSSVSNLQDQIGMSIWIKAEGPTPSPQPKIWPLPRKYSFGKTTIPLASSLTFVPNIASNILNNAIKRYKDMIFNEEIKEHEKNSLLLSSVSINVGSSSDSMTLETDESYSINITSFGASITAKTIYGAMYGLETFSQLIVFNYSSRQYQINEGPWNIEDYPQFPHRSILLDTSRHYLPINTLKRVIDSMSYSKLNTLHWHIVDTQSFPLESIKFPKLWEGSWSPKERYTQAAVANLVQYAKERGVRIMPEFDGPGHAWSWGVGYPQVLPENYNSSPSCDNTCPTNPCDVPLDPSNEFTFQLIAGLFSEVTGGAKNSGLFPYELLHLGGDEVQYGCWNESQRIAAFLIKNKIDFDGLYEYFIKRTSQVALLAGRNPVHWEEVFNHFGNKLDPKTIIHVWLDHETLSKVVTAGYRGILSNQDHWYLDHLNVPWTTFYTNDPYQNIPENKRNLVIGGTACMWGESVDPSDIFQRIWPRAAAFAERMWNYDAANQDDAVEIALPRLSHFRCQLIERGIDSAPVNSFSPNQPGGCANQ